jgi:hypothetical protein
MEILAVGTNLFHGAQGRKVGQKERQRNRGANGMTKGQKNRGKEEKDNGTEVHKYRATEGNERQTDEQRDRGGKDKGIERN